MYWIDFGYLTVPLSFPDGIVRQIKYRKQHDSKNISVFTIELTNLFGQIKLTGARRYQIVLQIGRDKFLSGCIYSEHDWFGRHISLTYENEEWRWSGN